MADPANIDTSTPDPALATNDIEKQKALLNDLIAEEGQSARQLYERQGPESQALLQARLGDAGAQPDARRAVYDAFIRDQTAAEQQHARTMQRQAAFNSQFMEAAKAAVPIHSKNVDAAIEAMRLQFEERQRREQEAAAARASASARSRVNPLIQAASDKLEFQSWLKENGLSPSGVDAPLEDVEGGGFSGSRLALPDVAQSLGINYDTFFGGYSNEDISAINSQMAKDIKDSKGKWTFNDFATNLQDTAGLIGLPEDLVNLMLGSYAPIWGLKPSDVVNQDAFQKIRGAANTMRQEQSVPGRPGF